MMITKFAIQRMTIAGSLPNNQGAEVVKLYDTLEAARADVADLRRADKTANYNVVSFQVEN